MNIQISLLIKGVKFNSTQELGCYRQNVNALPVNEGLYAHC